MLIGIGGRKRSIDLAFSFEPDRDPLVISALSVFKRFASEIWSAGLPGQYRNQFNLSLGTLGVAISSYLAENPTPPTRASGPISAFHKSLLLAGWRFETPFVLNTPGRTVYLLHSCPKVTAKFFKEDLAKALVLRGINKLDSSNTDPKINVLRQQGVFLQPLHALYKRLSPAHKRTLVSIVSDGLFTNFDFCRMGYAVSPECPVCGQSLDTVFHRCFSCSHTAQCAQHTLGYSLFNAIVEAGDTSLLATQCLFPCPRYSCEPADVMQIKYVNMQAGDTLSPLDGPVFGDGSCLNPSHPLLARAGAAIAQVYEDGSIFKAVYVALPASMRQTPLDAECLALALAAHSAEAPIAYIGDCQAVLDAFQQGYRFSLGPDSSNACAWKSLYKDFPDISVGIATVVKTKAHRIEADVSGDGPDGLFCYRGNKVVDKLARDGALLHPYNEGEIKAYLELYTGVQQVAYHMIDVLQSMRMSRIEKFGRPTRVAANTRWPRRHKDEHKFAWCKNAWVCQVCLLRKSSVTSRLSSCSLLPRYSTLLSNMRGHILMTCTDAEGIPFVYCRRCFLYANPHPRKLRRPCCGAAVVNSSSKFYILRLRHPVSRLRLSRASRVHDLNFSY